MNRLLDVDFAASVPERGLNQALSHWEPAPQNGGIALFHFARRECLSQGGRDLARLREEVDAARFPIQAVYGVQHGKLQFPLQHVAQTVVPILAGGSRRDIPALRYGDEVGILVEHRKSRVHRRFREKRRKVSNALSGQQHVRGVDRAPIDRNRAGLDPLAPLFARVVPKAAH